MPFFGNEIEALFEEFGPGLFIRALARSRVTLAGNELNDAVLLEQTRLKNKLKSSISLKI